MDAVAIFNTSTPEGILAHGIKLLCPLGTVPRLTIHSSLFGKMASAKKVKIQLREGNYTLNTGAENGGTRITSDVDQNGHPKAQMLQVWYKAPFDSSPYSLGSDTPVEAPVNEEVPV